MTYPFFTPVLEAPPPPTAIRNVELPSAVAADAVAEIGKPTSTQSLIPKKNAQKCTKRSTFILRQKKEREEHLYMSMSTAIHTHACMYVCTR